MNRLVWLVVAAISLGTRPPWWRVFQRRRWDVQYKKLERAYAEEMVAQVMAGMAPMQAVN